MLNQYARQMLKQLSDVESVCTSDVEAVFTQMLRVSHRCC